MNNTERNCDTCNDSYYMTEKNTSFFPPLGFFSVM